MFKHETVLKDKAIRGLYIKPNGVYVDCTVGGGGHAEAILQQLDEGGLLIAFDQDKEALNAAKERLHQYLSQILFINRNFKYLE